MTELVDDNRYATSIKRLIHAIAFGGKPGDLQAQLSIVHHMLILAQIALSKSYPPQKTSNFYSRFSLKTSNQSASIGFQLVLFVAIEPDEVKTGGGRPKLMILTWAPV